MMLKKTIIFVLIFYSINCFSQKSNVNKYRIYVGAGDRNVISDFISLQDKNFSGEVSWQYRAGLRIKDNYEINAAAYYRNILRLNPQMAFNKNSGYSASLVYEHRNPKSRVGYPFGFEVMQFTNNIDSSFTDGRPKYYENYNSLSYGFKIGLRYHFSRFIFLETEANFMYEKFNSDTNWGGYQRKFTSNSINSFKFLGMSLNICL